MCIRAEREEKSAAAARLRRRAYPFGSFFSMKETRLYSFCLSTSGTPLRSQKDNQSFRVCKMWWTRFRHLPWAGVLWGEALC